MKWSDVIGQQEVKVRLKALAGGGRMPHALMLCGATGHGTLALALAMASRLLCQTPDDDDNACGQCPQCSMLRTWHHPDLHFCFPIIKPDGKSADYKPVSDDFMEQWHRLLDEEGYYPSLHAWLDTIKAKNKQAIINANQSDEIAKKLALKSSQGGYKVCIIWLAERMNLECANKLLKTLEEPPQQTVFLLAVEQPEALIETIRSRVQRIDVPAISTEDLQQALITQRGLDNDTAYHLARASYGNWQSALEQLRPDNEQQMFLELFKTLMRSVWQKNVVGMKKWSDTVGDATSFGREKQLRLLRYFMRMIRESFMSNFQNPDLTYMTSEEEAFVKNFGRFVHEGNVIEINELLELAVRDITQNTSSKIVLFDTALRFTALLQRKP